MGLASYFAAPDPAIRIIFQSNGPLQPARGQPEPLDQGFGSVGFLQPGLDIAQPGVIRLARIASKGRFRVFLLPK